MKSKLIIFLTVAALVAGGIFWYLALTKEEETEDTNNSEETAEENTDTAPIESETVTPEVATQSNVNFGSDFLNLAVGETKQITLSFSTGTNPVRAAELNVLYNPAIISVENIAEGADFDLYIGKEIDVVNGIASLSGSKIGDAVITEDTVNFATLTVKRLAEGPAELKVVSIEEGKDFYSSFVDADSVTYSFNSSILPIE
jgi:hypothetical protein